MHRMTSHNVFLIDFIFQDFLFSRGTVGMTLDRYFKRKDVLPNPHGELSLNITPALISSMNKSPPAPARSGNHTTSTFSHNIKNVYN